MSKEAENVFHAGDAEDQYLTFMLADEEYGLEILRVQEIKGWEDTTPIPNTPDYVLGVINIRGEIVPIIDLRSRFRLESAPRTPTTVVVVVRIESADQERTIGLVVDAVSDVYRFESEQVQTTPALGEDAKVNCIKGLVAMDNKMVLLVDVDEMIDLDSIRRSTHNDTI